MMKTTIKSIIAISCLSFSSVIFSADHAEFVFNVRVLQNTCNIAIEGTSKNKVDFGSIPIKKLASDANNGAIKLPFIVTLSDCKNSNFSGNYIQISGNYVNNGYLDSPAGKDFAIRISDKDGAKSSDNSFFSDTKNKIWTNISGNNLNKTFYAYVMCKNGVTNCSNTAGNVGKFKATVTLTYLAD